MMKLFASSATPVQQPGGGALQKAQTQFLLASAQIDDKKQKEMSAAVAQLQTQAPIAVHPQAPGQAQVMPPSVTPQQQPTPQQLSSPSMHIQQSPQNANPQLKRTQPTAAQANMPPFNVMQSYVCCFNCLIKSF